MDALLKQIQACYGDLEDPNFGFVKAALKKRPYSAIEKEITEAGFRIAEDTDPDDDVSFVYQLAKDRREWGLQLSMVGPYAVLLRVTNQGRSAELVQAESSLHESEKELMRILKKNAVVLLGQTQLEASIPLALSNAEPENTKIFQALFTDTDILPWEFGMLAPK